MAYAAGEFHFPSYQSLGIKARDSQLSVVAVIDMRNFLLAGCLQGLLILSRLPVATLHDIEHRLTTRERHNIFEERRIVFHEKDAYSRVGVMERISADRVSILFSLDLSAAVPGQI